MDDIDEEETKKMKFERIPDDFYKLIYKKYNLSYFQKFNTDIYSAIIIIFIVFLGVSYNYAKINAKSIADDWNNQKCKPNVMPFAGLINLPPDGSTIIEFTSNNFKDCMKDIFTDIANDATMPINIIIDVIKDFFDAIKDMINAIRQFVDYIRSSAQNIFQEMMGKLLNMFVGIQELMIYMKDLFSKIQGIMVGVLYLSISIYYTMKSAIGAFYELIVIILLIMAAIVLVLWIIPVTWGAAAAGLVIFLAISIPLGIIAAVMAEAFDLSLGGMPGAPTCFGDKTIIEMNDGSFKNIKYIKIGDILKNNNRVLNTFKCLSEYEDFYKINNTIVSGSHYIFKNNKSIKVCNYDNAIKEDYNSKYTYCLATESKILEIDNEIYLDFDDVKIENIKNIDFLNKKVDGGLSGNTKIKLKNGSEKEIKNINLGEVLYDNVIVLGIVKLDVENLYSNNFYIINKNIIHENNLFIHEDKKDLIKNIKPLFNVDLEDKVLYHLVTSKGYFFIENIQLVHYSEMIDIYIKNYN
uniref:Hedgehog/Intein (Hint) domain-containing protein n=1 Tax=viral metagenome TaxID=1070528 RepID=A0A6C0AXL0_9ZZZZ|tara:strand:- start:15299 stop:16867 length:1569 start_codon:yes stop_codon:yes gene_type:complete